MAGATLTAVLTELSVARRRGNHDTTQINAQYGVTVSVFTDNVPETRRNPTYQTPTTPGFYFFSGTIFDHGKVRLVLRDNQVVIVQVIAYKDKTLGLCAECLVNGSSAHMYPRGTVPLKEFAGKWLTIDTSGLEI